MKKQLILDYSKWRCGGIKIYKNSLGEGLTRLENNEGFQCCLGQFSLQLNNTIKNQDIINLGGPRFINKKIPLLSIKLKGDYKNTMLAYKAININDSTVTTPAQKIKELRKLFLTKGYTIKVINKK